MKNVLCSKVSLRCFHRSQARAGEVTMVLGIEKSSRKRTARRPLPIRLIQRVNRVWGILAYNFIKIHAHFGPSSAMAAGFMGFRFGIHQTSLIFGSLMSALRKEQHDQAKYNPERKPFDIAQGRVRYALQKRRRNRRNLRVASLIILAVGIGVVVVLLANWLSP